MAVAGWVDAIGFLRLGQFFVSFMSGDSTHFAVSSLSQQWAEAAGAGTLVGLFVAGVFLGRLLCRSAGLWGRPAVLGVESVLLVLGATIGSSSAAVSVPVAIAMGMQNAAIDRRRLAGMGLSYVTGTLVSLGEGLADAVGARDASRRWAWIPYLLHWLALVAGAACGTLAYRAWARSGLLFPAAVILFLALLTASRIRRSRAR